MLLQQLRQDIAAILNQSGVPIDAAYYVLKDILNEVAEIMNQQLQQEQMAEAAAQVEKSEVKAEETEAAAQIEKKEEE